VDPLLYSPYDYAVHEDPYPIYARLREEAPLYRNDDLDFWAVSRHADVAGAFRDHQRFSNANGVSLDPSAWGPAAHRTMSFLALDPPSHTRMRSLVAKGFTPRRVRELEAGILRLTERHLAPAVARGDFDFVADFAGRLPMDVVCELMGVPEADRDELRRLADLVMHREEGLSDVPVAGMEAALTLIGYYQDLVTERRARPGSDLTSALLAAEEGGDRLAEEEVVAFLFLMVVAGNETTTRRFMAVNLDGALLCARAAHPHRRRRRGAAAGGGVRGLAAQARPGGQAFGRRHGRARSDHAPRHHRTAR
jgi:cytochrome P450